MKKRAGLPTARHVQAKPATLLILHKASREQPVLRPLPVTNNRTQAALLISPPILRFFGSKDFPNGDPISAPPSATNFQRRQSVLESTPAPS